MVKAQVTVEALKYLQKILKCKYTLLAPLQPAGCCIECHFEVFHLTTNNLLHPFCR